MGKAAMSCSGAVIGAIVFAWCTATVVNILSPGPFVGWGEALVAAPIGAIVGACFVSWLIIRSGNRY